MKTQIFCQLVVVLGLMAFLNSVQAQVIVGSVNAGNAVVTDYVKAESILKANLPAGATVSTIKLQYSEYDVRYYLVAVVSNSSVNSIGIQTDQAGNALSIGAGPGVTITCTGRNCGDCRLEISKWRPRCRCHGATATDYACDMTQVGTVGL